jgi:hypothetical protein
LREHTHTHTHTEKPNKAAYNGHPGIYCKAVRISIAEAFQIDEPRHYPSANSSTEASLHKLHAWRRGCSQG